MSAREVTIEWERERELGAHDVTNRESRELVYTAVQKGTFP